MMGSRSPFSFVEWILRFFLFGTVFCGTKEEIAQRSRTHFGCVFSDTNYSLQTEEPKWGAKALPPMVFKNDADWKAFEQDMGVTLEGQVDTGVYNDVDVFLDFINLYKNVKKEKSSSNLELFYKQFHYPFDRMDHSNFEIVFFDEMQSTYPGLVDHFFLAAGYWNVTEEFIARVKKGQGFQSTPPTHFAGVIKISIKSMLKSRTGYVLIDLGMSVTDPIIIMEDGKFPHSQDFTYKISGKKIKYELNEKSNFILGTVYVSNKIESRHLYYLGKPYCSFIDTTLKPRLLMPIHGYRSWHYPVAKINFLMLPENILGEKPSLYFEFKDVGSRGGSGDNNVMETSVSLFQEDIRNISSTLKSMSKVLLLENDTLNLKLCSIKQIFKNEMLIEEFYSVAKKRNYIREIKFTSPVEYIVYLPRVSGGKRYEGPRNVYVLGPHVTTVV